MVEISNTVFNVVLFRFALMDCGKRRLRVFRYSTLHVTAVIFQFFEPELLREDKTNGSIGSFLLMAEVQCIENGVTEAEHQ